MSWKKIELTFDSRYKSWPGPLQAHLPVRTVKNLKNRAHIEDYEMRTFETLDESPLDYMLIVENIIKDIANGPKRVVVTLRYDKEGNYQPILDQIQINAEKMGLERILDDAKEVAKK